MIPRRSFLKLMIPAAMALVAGVPSLAMADRRDELQARFKKRFEQVRQYKDQGKVGETSTGLLEAVKDADDALKSLIEAENADRRELYRLIAEKEGTTPDVVARTNAIRNFRRAKAGDWLKADDGKWRQK